MKEFDHHEDLKKSKYKLCTAWSKIREKKSIQNLPKAFLSFSDGKPG